MKTEEMKIISEHLIDAMSKEDLTTREAAKALNLNSIYVSMAKSSKSWSSMSKDVWYRLTQWHNSRGKITEFEIPGDEPIWKPTGKQPENKLSGKAEVRYGQLPVPEFPDSGNTNKKSEKNRTDAGNIFPGIRTQLVEELQIRLTEIDTERAGIEKLLEQYMV
jgi:hypothetical protein